MSRILTPRRELVLPRYLRRGEPHSKLCSLFAPAPFFAGGLTADGADFDGATTYMTRAVDLVGNADSKSGIFSGWFRLDGGDGGSMQIYDSRTISQSVSFLRNSSNKFQFVGRNAAGTVILDISSSTSYTAGATWLNVLASWDLAASAAHLYVNDASDLVSTTLTNDTIDYTRPNHGIGATSAGGNLFNGCMQEYYLGFGQFLDFSVTANRRKFINSARKPVSLGATGSVPTGSAPIGYFHLDVGEAVANFATNRGTGGNFTITGTLTTASSRP